MSWPQLIVTDSSRSGKLPFAPFKRTQEESAQQDTGRVCTAAKGR